jgi:hypothetical protein
MQKRSSPRIVIVYIILLKEYQMLCREPYNTRRKKRHKPKSAGNENRHHPEQVLTREHNGVLCNQHSGTLL